ncbi:MAG: LysR family transcriptional regulator [Acidimicrobiales bacterium]
MDVHLRDLRYFVAVAEEVHFTRAAERLHVSQPALSKQIRLLERHLRAALFIREPRAVRLTAAGEVLLGHAREVLDRWDAGLADVNDAAAGDRRVLVVGIHTSVGRDLQRRTLAAFAGRRPDWRLSL